ncbi:uncharacterized protein M437DRAFT_83373 [Aureobasidium melanogenum CBS 110374]|uniref:Uncharacterized protein n=1 Tax=Aureobasidium melanogenum (strain CBS 110374) TaxID=1043003 RepID=A0A074VYS9_AURM1|nr:uncharacterized protein M437DRAFT_83373 [Aureobasidium melanogenum CBS 110374]KEQ64439.1 hypothetical protein M437DRAFT_83373 [Aureobasidium melanogenum CBS 110374]
MSTQAPYATDVVDAAALDHEVFQQELLQAINSADPMSVNWRNLSVLLKARINLPHPIILAKWVERFTTQLRWSPYDSVPFVPERFPGVKLISAHHTYPQRDTVMLMLSVPGAVWESLQHSSASDSITILEHVGEENVVGDLQMTYLLTRAARRVNEGPISIDQFMDDLKRVCLAMNDGYGDRVVRNFVFPRVKFTVKMTKENHEDSREPTGLPWNDIRLQTKSMSRSGLKFLGESPCEGGSETTFVIAKDYWPYLEAISHTYCFAGYVEKREYREISPNRHFRPSPEPTQAIADTQSPQRATKARSL